MSGLIAIPRKLNLRELNSIKHKKFLNLSESAKLCCVSSATLRERIKKGQIPIYKEKKNLVPISYFKNAKVLLKYKNYEKFVVKSNMKEKFILIKEDEYACFTEKIAQENSEIQENLEIKENPEIRRIQESLDFFKEQINKLNSKLEEYEGRFEGISKAIKFVANSTNEALYAMNDEIERIAKNERTKDTVPNGESTC